MQINNKVLKRKVVVRMICNLKRVAIKIRMMMNGNLKMMMIGNQMMRMIGNPRMMMNSSRLKYNCKISIQHKDYKY